MVKDSISLTERVFCSSIIHYLSEIVPNCGRFSPSQILGGRPSKSYTHFITPVVLMFLCMFFNVFYKSEKTCFYVFLNSKINVFNIYGLGPMRIFAGVRWAGHGLQMRVVSSKMAIFAYFTRYILRSHTYTLSATKL